MILRVLLAAYGPGRSPAVSATLRASHILLSTAAPEEDLWRALGREPWDLLVADEAALGSSPAATVEEIRELPEPPEILVLVEPGSSASGSELVAAGAFAVVDAGLPPELLERTLREWIRRRRALALLEREANGAVERRGMSELIADSEAMRALLAAARRVVAKDSALLLRGEMGSGREALARAMHRDGPRARGPFVSVRCGVTVQCDGADGCGAHTAYEELYGCKGSQRSAIELAHGGVLYLDEIAWLSPRAQAELMRVLTDRRIRYPDGREMPVDVRVIAATRGDILQEVAAGRFRSDLYHRIGAVTLFVPPLRERRDDLPRLAELFLERERVTLQKPTLRFATDALAALARHVWPANLSELERAVAAAALESSGEEIRAADLPLEVRRGGLRVFADGALVPAPSAVGEEGDGFGHGDGWDRRLLAHPLLRAREEVLEAFERRYIEELLKLCGGRIGESARRAGLSARSLYEKMKRLGLRKETFKRIRA